EYGEEYNWLKKGKVKHDETLADRDELEVIRTYQTIVRGIIQHKIYLLRAYFRSSGCSYFAATAHEFSANREIDLILWNLTI
ncbi:MAG: hypothetical protein Q8807_03715, partial ['Waltheria sp.' little leaf phytoplasma]|nr:hypothetical protein ['Waltheria sp.' little leaf phytoplasma]